jgi:hydroxymethylglutaryl-CoA synthase
MVGHRSLNPLYEDAVTMAANAARPLLDDDTRRQIGLLIFGTETANDLSRPASTHIIEAFGLPSNIRNFEVKHACYSGTAALCCALDWIRSGAHCGRKALILASDFSRTHLRGYAEPVMGGCAAAAVISETPSVIAYEPNRCGVWSGGVYDTFRPDGRLEIVDEQLSLFSYLEALHESYQEYAALAGEEIGERYFTYQVYHMPFPAMAYRAHRALMSRATPGESEAIQCSFRQRVQPSLCFASQVGSVYGASNLIALCGLLHQEKERVHGGERVGFFSYGSGAIGQYYSGLLLPGASAAIAAQGMAEALEQRMPVTVDQYERIETERRQQTGTADFEPDLGYPERLFESWYQGKQRLFLKKVENYRRIYEWS